MIAWSRVANVCRVMTDSFCCLVLVVFDVPGAGPRLSARSLWELHAFLVEGGFGEPGRRELLLAGLPPVVAAGLPVFARPGDQLWSDLCRLNQMETPGEWPLSVYVHNAVGVLGGRAPRRLRAVAVAFGRSRSAG